MKLELKRFDMKSVKDDAVCMFLGARGSGKTVTVIDTLRHHRDLPIGVVVSPTEMANGTFSQVIPRMLIYDEYTPQLLEKFVDRQKKIMTKYNREIAEKGKSDIDPRAFLLLDDCMYSSSWVKDSNIRYVFMNGRHLKIFFLLTSQYPLGVPPVLRANVDYVFICRNPIRADRQRIYDSWAGVFPSFQIYEDVMAQCTENYEMLVIHKTSQSNKLTDCVFWYKADPNPNFKMCAKDLWELQKIDEQRRAMQEDEEEPEEEEFDPRMVHRSKGPQIKVRKV